MSRRARIAGYGSAALLIVGGAVAAAVGDGAGQVVALVLFGLGFLLATSLVFAEVGLSEDRERAARERAARERATRERANGRRRPRLGRVRGHRRRLG